MVIEGDGFSVGAHYSSEQGSHLAIQLFTDLFVVVVIAAVDGATAHVARACKQMMMMMMMLVVVVVVDHPGSAQRANK